MLEFKTETMNDRWSVDHVECKEGDGSLGKIKGENKCMIPTVKIEGFSET